MTAKEYLSQAFRLDQIIDSKLDQLASLRELALKATASIRQERTTGQKLRGSIEDAIAKLIDLEDEIDTDIDRLVDLKRELIGFIAKIDNQTYRLILELRYLQGKAWVEISGVMRYDLRWVYRMHGRALNEADQLLASLAKTKKLTGT